MPFWQVVATTGSMFSFLAIFTLRYTGVHISSSNGRNIPSNIKASIDKTFGLALALNIPNVNPNDKYI